MPHPNSIDMIEARGWNPQDDRKLADNWVRALVSGYMYRMFVARAIYDNWA
jgi:hypothetical protein